MPIIQFIDLGISEIIIFESFFTEFTISGGKGKGRSVKGYEFEREMRILLMYFRLFFYTLISFIVFIVANNK